MPADGTGLPDPRCDDARDERPRAPKGPFRQETGITLPVIMISSHGDVRMAVEAMRAGACHFLEKPLRRRKLWEAMREATGGTRKRG